MPGSHRQLGSLWRNGRLLKCEQTPDTPGSAETPLPSLHFLHSTPSAERGSVQSAAACPDCLGPCKYTRSIPARHARSVLTCNCDKQSDRPGFAYSHGRDGLPRHRRRIYSLASQSLPPLECMPWRYGPFLDEIVSDHRSCLTLLIGSLTFATEAFGDPTLVWYSCIFQASQVLFLGSWPHLRQLTSPWGLLEEVSDFVLTVFLARKIDESMRV